MRLGKLVIILGFLLSVSVPLQAKGIVLTEDDVSAALAREFGEQGFDGSFEFEFFGGQTNFALENAKAAKIMVFGLKTEADSNKFTAKAEIFADGGSVAQTTLSGKYYTMGEAWVPVQDLEKGTILTDDMLKSVPVRMNRVKALNVIDKAKLVGMQAQRGLKEGKIINEKDIGPIVIMPKGKIVTSVYLAKGMQITAQVEVLEDGAKGQTVEVRNTKSDKRFYAKVVDADTVEIRAD